MKYQLFLGNRTYASWSLRTWLLCQACGIPVEERVVSLYTPAFEQMKHELFPARQVPALEIGEGAARQVIWDSLAIVELLAERHPGAGLWPAEPGARAAARALCAEMHSGFKALRAALPMNLRRRYPGRGQTPEIRQDIDRVCSLWAWTQARWGADGPYLFGADFCAADAFFAPVATRFETYAVALEPQAQSYAEALLALPALAAWRAAAEAEPWVFPHCEFDD